MREIGGRFIRDFISYCPIADAVCTNMQSDWHARTDHSHCFHLVMRRWLVLTLNCKMQLRYKLVFMVLSPRAINSVPA